MMQAAHDIEARFGPEAAAAQPAQVLQVADTYGAQADDPCPHVGRPLRTRHVPAGTPPT